MAAEEGHANEMSESPIETVRHVLGGLGPFYYLAFPFCVLSLYWKSQFSDKPLIDSEASLAKYGHGAIEKQGIGISMLLTVHVSSLSLLTFLRPYTAEVRTQILKPY